MTCRECDEDYLYDEGCIDGDIWVKCISEYCGGFCEKVGICNCECHDD